MERKLRAIQVQPRALQHNRLNLLRPPRSFDFHRINLQIRHVRVTVSYDHIELQHWTSSCSLQDGSSLNTPSNPHITTETACQSSWATSQESMTLKVRDSPQDARRCIPAWRRMGLILSRMKGLWRASQNHTRFRRKIMRSCFSRGICSRRQSGPWMSSWKLTMIITSVGRTCPKSSMRLELFVNCYDLSLIALFAAFWNKFIFLIDFDQVEMHRNA